VTADTGVAEAGPRLTPAQRKAILAGAIGNTVEWVDWAIYTALASIFAGQFFPSGDRTAGLLATLAVFAAGFLMRPIGGALLGAYADRHGRKTALTLTIGLMAAAALVIAACPTYRAIGVATPIILLLARLVQGFSAGGEFASSSAFLAVFGGTAPYLTTWMSAHGLSGWVWLYVTAGGLVGVWVYAVMPETKDVELR